MLTAYFFCLAGGVNERVTIVFVRAGGGLDYASGGVITHYDTGVRGDVLRDETFCDLRIRFTWSVPFLRVAEILKHGKNIFAYGGQCWLMASSLFS